MIDVYRREEGVWRGSLYANRVYARISLVITILVRQRQEFSYVSSNKEVPVKEAIQLYCKVS